ncbi:hypothetical protein K402DRAFT_423560 [Aulographum hederae CBS 113979]|uniref:Uncharacterized protein n=1 Tax=Aulographum hederae CBS 113979 TaxID=1176131 RepID=A0A6G1GRW8_9PEZI|nr:hypothetical protein K402DRAFT_423560 [Aulographum hederae CBS 113979]
MSSATPFLSAVPSSKRKRTRDDDDERESSEKRVRPHSHCEERPNSADMHSNRSFDPPADALSRPMSTPNITPSNTANSSPFSLHSTVPSPADDMDMDHEMADNFSLAGSHSPTSPAHPWSDAQFRPPKAHAPSPFMTDASPHYQLSGGRMPTPIYNNFPTAMPPPRESRTHSDVSAISIGDPAHLSPAFASRQTCPSMLQMWKRQEREEPRHSLPFSPISEGASDMDNSTLWTSSQLSRLSVSNDDGMDMDMDMETNEAPAPVDGGPVTPRTGRARSGAFTEKKRYVFGYREDCEKCRNRVPGHVSHFYRAEG